MPTPSKWSQITAGAADFNRINTTVHRLHHHHRRRYYKHSVESVTRFIKPSTMSCVIKGNLTDVQVPRLYAFDHDKDAGKELSAFFWLRNQPTKFDAGYCLTIAGKKFPQDMAIADMRDRDFLEMFTEANRVCWDFQTQYPLIPIEVMCDENELGPNDEPTTDPDLADFWNYALTKDLVNPFIVPDPTSPFEADKDFADQYPNIAEGAKIYRWSLHPQAPV